MSLYQSSPYYRFFYLISLIMLYSFACFTETYSDSYSRQVRFFVRISLRPDRFLEQSLETADLQRFYLSLMENIFLTPERIRLVCLRCYYQTYNIFRRTRYYDYNCFASLPIRSTYFFRQLFSVRSQAPSSYFLPPSHYPDS